MKDLTTTPDTQRTGTRERGQAGTKDTKDKELRSLPEGWVWTTVGQVTLPIQKVSPKQKPDVSFVYIDISSIDNSIQRIVEPKRYLGSEAPSRARQLIRANDVVFSTVRTYLKNVALVPEIYDEQIASTGFSVLRANDAVQSKFLFYFTLTDEFLFPLNELQRGTSYPAVRDGDVRIQPFPLPPLPEQERIVARLEELLSDLEAGVVALERVRAGAKRYKRSVLKAACEGKLVLQDQSDEPIEIFLQRIGKHSSAGADLLSLPSGWMWIKVSDLFDVSYGLSESLSKTKPDDEFDIPVIRIPNVTEFGSLDLTNLKYFPLDHKKRENLLLKKGDVLFNWRNAPKWIGRSTVFDKAGEYVNASFLLKLRPSTAGYSEFVAMYLNHLRISGYFMTIVNNAVNQANFNATRTSQVEIPLPPLVEQRRIVAEVERRLDSTRAVEAAVEVGLKRAERLRQAVLRSAFEGKLGYLPSLQIVSHTSFFRTGL